MRYYSAKSVAVDLCGLLGLAEGFVENGDKIIEEEELDSELIAAAHLVAAGIPTYFVRPDQIEHFGQSPEDAMIDWKSISLPIESASFVLPRGAITHSKLGPIRFVWFARIRKNSEVVLSTGTKYENPDSDYFVIRTSVAIPKSTATMPFTIVWDEEEGTEVTLPSDSAISDMGADQEDTVIILRLARLVLNMASLIETDPDQVERGIVTEPTGPPREERDVWERFFAGRQAATEESVRKIGRNEPCPCGSGKKYKKCHGASAPSIHFGPATLPEAPVPLGLNRSQIAEKRTELRDALNRAALSMVDFENDVEGYVRYVAEAYHDHLKQDHVQDIEYGLSVLTATRPGAPKGLHNCDALVSSWGKDNAERQRNIYTTGRKAAGIEGMPLAVFFQFETWATDNAEPDLSRSISDDPLSFEQLAFIGTTPDGRTVLGELRCKRGENNQLVPVGEVRFGSTVKPETGILMVQNTLAECFYKGWTDAMSEEIIKTGWSPDR